MLKQKMFLVLLIFLATCTSGCLITPKAEIEFRETVAVLGIDQEGESVKLTAVLVEIMHAGGTDSSGPTSSVFVSNGETMFDAIRNFHSYVDRDIMLGHMHFVIIGEETAKNGIAKYLDYLSRDHEVNQNCDILIARGYTAYDFINATNTEKHSIDSTLVSLIGDTEHLSESTDISILNYMQMLSNDTGCLYIPYVDTGMYKERSEEDKDKKDIVLRGYGIFDEDKLFCYLDDKMARGMNWVIDEIESGVIIVKDKDGDNISLEIISSKTKIEPEFSSDLPSANIKIEFTTNIGEYQGNDDIFTDEMIQYIVEEQNKYIEREISKTIIFLQSRGLDAIGICSAIYHKYPKETKQFEDSWKEVFHNMQISLEIDSTINRTYNINEPITNTEKKK